MDRGQDMVDDCRWLDGRCSLLMMIIYRSDSAGHDGEDEDKEDDEEEDDGDGGCGDTGVCEEALRKHSRYFQAFPYAGIFL